MLRYGEVQDRGLEELRVKALLHLVTREVYPLQPRNLQICSAEVDKERVFCQKARLQSAPIRLSTILAAAIRFLLNVPLESPKYCSRLVSLLAVFEQLEDIRPGADV